MYYTVFNTLLSPGHLLCIHFSFTVSLLVPQNAMG